MPTPVILPKQGNSVEACLITSWKKQPGDAIKTGEPIVEVETDKALFVVEAETDGILLAQFFNEGDDVPVMTTIAVVGQPGDDPTPFAPKQAETSIIEEPANVPTPLPATSPTAAAPSTVAPGGSISPRALKLAQANGIDTGQIAGTGPEGRIIERDIQFAVKQRPLTTRAARHTASLPSSGTGLGGRVTTTDLQQQTPAAATTNTTDAAPADDVEIISLTGIRKRTAQRMRQSLQETAQLTLNTSADARALLAYRKRLKSRDDMKHVTVNALVLYAVARTLPDFPALNATFDGETIRQYRHVHLGFAVDMPRGLIVPVIRKADSHSLVSLADEAVRLGEAAQAGKIMPDELQGGTFTVTNLGGLGIESFTPILNPPQIAILGVGTTQLKPVQVGDAVEHHPHLNLSLTIDHQALDGAPAARFLQALCQNISDIDLVLAK